MMSLLADYACSAEGLGWVADLLVGLFRRAMLSKRIVRMPILSVMFHGEFHSIDPAFSYRPVYHGSEKSA